MTIADSVYDRAQGLLALASRCRDDEIASEIRKIAKALIEVVYQEIEIVEVPPEDTAP